MVRWGKGIICYIKMILKYILNHFTKKKPIMIHISPTHRCNLRCKYCKIWEEGDETKELSLQEWKKVIDELSDWLGEAHIGVTGGEPFLRKDIFQILDYMVKKGLKPSLTTNGILLDYEMINRLSELNVFNIKVSFESMNKNTHDFFRGEGSYEKTYNAILNLKKKMNKTLIIIGVTINSKNIGELDELINFCKENDLKILFQNITGNFRVNYNGNFKEESEFKPNTKLNIKKTNMIINSSSELRLLSNYYGKKKFSYECSAQHKGNLWICDNGDIKLCQFMPKIGNANEGRIEDVWNSREADSMRKRMKGCKKICQFICYKKRSLFECYEMYRALYLK